MKVLLSGGGSGGHILPNIAIIRKLQEEQHKTPIGLCYIGEMGGMEESLLANEHIQFHGIYAGKLRRYLSFQNVLDVFKIVLGFFQALYFVVKENPDVIFSKGGYVSLPVVFAGWCLRKRIIIHESDVVPGLTTRITSHFANTICVSWDRTVALFPGKNVVLTGIPVREGLADGKAEKGRLFAGIEKNTLPTLLVLGGSLGAKAINDFLAGHLKYLLEHWNIVHVVGKGKSFKVSSSPRYSQLEYVNQELPDLYAFSDVIISRAGSTALAEYESVQKPVIMIPLTAQQSRGDQLDNAQEYVKKHPGTSAVILQEELSLPKLEEELERVKQGKFGREEEGGAVEKIVGVILGTI